MNLTTIIAEADVLVPNDMTVAEKVAFLNTINVDFFNQVKIPIIERFETTLAATYEITGLVKDQDIDYVRIGFLQYQKVGSSQLKSNEYVANDGEVILSPAPYAAGLPATIRYYRCATTTFTETSLTDTPDAPSEYHWTYVPALCVKLAQAMDDMPKAANYEEEYRTAWQAAAQDFGGVG